MERKRLVEIDYVKGLGILLMLVGHIQFSRLLNQYIYSFHMPLFFIISGYLYNENTDNFLRYIKKQTVHLLVPYLFFGIMFTALFIAFGHRMTIQSILLCFIMPNHSPFDWCGAIWFLLAMFEVKLLYNLLYKYVNKYVFISISILLIISGMIISALKIRLLFCLDSGLIGYLFYFMGHQYKIYSSRINNCLKRIPKSCFLFFLICGTFMCFLNDSVNMRENIYGNFCIFILTAICSTLLWILFFICFKNHISSRICQGLSFLNEYSISYMGLNQFLIAIINVFFINKISNIYFSLFCKSLELIIVIALVAICSIVIRRTKFRFVIGKIYS